MRELVWTREPPERVGWYWLRNETILSGDQLNVASVVEITEKRLSALGHRDFVARRFEEAEWAGPIPEPKEDCDASE